MRIFGQEKFSMTAKPVFSHDNSSVLYDTFASVTVGINQYNYSQVNGVAFISRKSGNNSVTTCLGSEPGHLPPINAIVAGINAATGSDTSSIGCPTGNLYQTLINGISFTLCATESQLTLYGADMDIAVEYLPYYSDIPTPTVNGECIATIQPTQVSTIGKSLLSGQFQVKRKLKAEFDFTFWSDDSIDGSEHSSSHSADPEHHFCSCKSTQRACIFIHGMGIDREEADNVDSFGYYWGNLTDHAPCCSSIKYAVLDTVNNSWTNDTQQLKVCDRALAVSETSSDSVIKDTILVTHSMGNLMLAGAIASGKCSLDSSTSWVGLAGPMKGSMGSDFVQASCAGETNDLLEQVADITGKCPPTNALISLAYQGERFSSVEQDAAYTAAQEAYTTNVTALMCSEGYSGLVSKYQAEFWVLGATVPHKSGDNDGMVEFESCVAGIPATQFGDTWRSKFYRTKLNHYDSEFLYGDGLLSEAKMPVKWFECLL
ncbi:hypothetical protein DVH05_004746 [Phytophthora capsici]|nr:hypothetical protein DVH05_004746 [Phytophthora capsici]